MKQIIGLSLLTTILFLPGVFAENPYKLETIVGIGATLEKLPDGTVQVDGLITNAPAERAGLAAGDKIVEIRSTPDSLPVAVNNLSLLEAVGLIRGPVGVPVEISFTRKNSPTIAVTIVREKFVVDDGS